jgi:hypothetical protein
MGQILDNKTFYSSESIDEFFSLLEQEKIRYVLIKNIKNELPEALKKGKDIDIVVHPEDYKLYQNVMARHHYIRLIHPEGRGAGWRFLYGMDENVKYQHLRTGIQVDAYAQLCTKSICMNAWLPLEKEINRAVWENKVWNDEKKWWEINEEVLILYLVTRSIFEKQRFTEEYIEEIEKRKKLLCKPTVQGFFEKVFFRFTNELIALIEARRYEEIIGRYMRFEDY